MSVSDLAEPTSMADRAERGLRRDLLDGVLPPAAALRIDELKARYDVGPSPLREALSRLVGSGLVSVEANRGFRVQRLSRDDLDDIALMRSTLESAALRRAIAGGDAAWEAGILAALHRLTRATETTGTGRAELDRWNAEHDAFHRALIDACGSPRMLAAQAALADQHRRYRVHLMGENLPRALLIAEHRGLADAALARDAEGAARLLDAHMRITSAFYAAALGG